MVKKVLLGLGLVAVACMASAQTPVFSEGFDAEQTKQPTDLGWYEFINSQEGDTRTIVTDEPYAGAGCLQFVNSDAALCENQGWQRAIKFRNLPLQEGKIYQINFALKGSNTYTSGDNNPKCSMRLGLMQGYENSDISILGANGQDQTYTIQDFDEDNYVEYSRSFYFASKENQDAQYKAQGKDEQYIDKYFATFNIINPGTFYLDEVKLIELESAVESIVYGGDVIRVKYMFDTNIASLAKADALGRVILDPSCATVLVGEDNAKVEAVELHQDGYLYIFFEEEYFEEEAEDDIFVTFTNPNDIINFSGTADNAKLFAFTAAKADGYDEEVANVSSFAYEEAVMVSSDPADNSFTLDETISEFTLTFDHNIFTCETTDYNAPKGKLSTGEDLKIKEGQEELSKSITFVRTGTAPLTKGAYSVIVSGITTEKGTECTSDQVINFETGKIQMAKTVYTKQGECLVTSGEINGIPEGWTVITDSEERTFGNTYGSGGRIIGRSIPPFDRGLYFRAAGDDQESYVISPEFEIPAGDNIELRVLVGGWSATSVNLDFQVLDAEDEEVYSQNVNTEENNFDGNGNGRTIGQVPFRFKSAGGNHKVKVTLNTHGYTGGYLVGYEVYTYEETPGDKFDPEIIFESKFENANMPAEGTGWLFYENNSQLTPGSGRSGTSGMLSGNFHSKMQIAAFFRECGANDAAAMRIEYANGNGIEGGFEIPEGNYEFTYYAGTWNDDGGNKAGTSKVFMQLINAETGEVALNSEHVNIANFKNGGDLNGQADKVEGKFNSKGGKYYLKAWGTTNTVWGSLSIIKPGSKAAQYYAKMMEAVEAAKAELALSEDDKYNGSTKSELIAFTEKCSDPSWMHTVEEFTVAIEQLNKLTADMTARRKNIDAFEGNRNTLAESLGKAEGTKFEGLDVYPSAVECYNIYKEVDPSTLDDATLASAVADMGNMGKLLGNMMGTCVDLLTKQAVELAAMIVALDPETESHSYVLAAGDAISDDQGLVANLKKLYTSKLYKKLGAGENPFVEYLEDEEPIEIPKTIEAGAFIQNREFYSTTIVPDNEQTAVSKETDFPGWTIKVFNGQIRPVFNTGWGEDGNAPRATKPIANAAVRANYGRNEYDVHQLITNMPVAIYNVSIVVAKDGEQATESYAYVGEGEYQLKSVSEITDRASNVAQEFDSVETVINGNFGEMLLGGYINIDASFGSIDNANLVMVGPVKDFPYAEAAAALEKEIIDEIEEISYDELGEPVKVEYYNLKGVKVSVPVAGSVAIEVAHYKGGQMKVSKIVVTE